MYEERRLFDIYHFKFLFSVRGLKQIVGNLGEMEIEVVTVAGEGLALHYLSYHAPSCTFEMPFS